ncbi:MAG TPA: hypothetical protein VK818_04325 [Methylomirabilota bacterium]|nr:hypothetical protein [Methylomirabilota bacterium]
MIKIGILEKDETIKMVVQGTTAKGGAGALGYDFAGVLMEGADLGDAVYGFLDLGVGFE